MENKYYTPSIEEFFVGFECEWQSKIGQKPWNKQICDVDLVNIAYDSFEHSDIEEPFNEQFRVKYLDSSDIEEFLNIKPKLGESYIFLKDVNFRPNWLIGVYAHKIRIFFNPLTKWLKVEYLLTGNEEFEKFFEGSVKNKSEFIKLLRFLGYE